VRDDAVISDRNRGIAHEHLPCGADRSEAAPWCQ
jgi:hypothetical protein